MGIELGRAPRAMIAVAVVSVLLLLLVAAPANAQVADGENGSGPEKFLVGVGFSTSGTRGDVLHGFFGYQARLSDESSVRVEYFVEPWAGSSMAVLGSFVNRFDPYFVFLGGGVIAHGGFRAGWHLGSGIQSSLRGKPFLEVRLTSREILFDGINVMIGVGFRF